MTQACSNFYNDDRNLTTMGIAVIDCATKLIAVMNEETLALSQFDFKKLVTLTPQKEQLADHYVTLAQELKKQGFSIGALSPVLQKSFATTLHSLHTTAETNSRTVHAAQEMNRRMIDFLIRKIESEDVLSQTYDLYGTVVEPATRKISTTGVVSEQV